MGTLKMGTIFATWIKDRIRQYGFVEGLDFVTFSVIPENGGRRVEYYGTLSMGKELAMVENNDRGRTYSSACRTSTAITSPLFQSRRSATSNRTRAAANARDRVPAFRRSTGPRLFVDKMAVNSRPIAVRVSPRTAAPAHVGTRTCSGKNQIYRWSPRRLTAPDCPRNPARSASS